MFFHPETEPAESAHDGGSLLAQNAGNDQHAVSAKCAVKAGSRGDQQLTEKIRGDDVETMRRFPAQEVAGKELRAANSVQPRIGLRVRDGAWIVVESEDFARAETPCGERKNSRSAAGVEQAPARRKLARRRFEQTQTHRGSRMFAGAKCAGRWNNKLWLFARLTFRHNNQPPPNTKRRAYFRLQIFLPPVTRQLLRRSSETPDQIRNFGFCAASNLHPTTRSARALDHRYITRQRLLERHLMRGQPCRGRVIFPEIHPLPMPITHPRARRDAGCQSRHRVKSVQSQNAMLIVMNANASTAEVDEVVRVIDALGLRAHPMPGATRTAIGITGNRGEVDLRHFENLPGVAEAIRVSKPYKLISLDLRPDRTVVDLGDGARIGDGSLALIAGPCAVETREQVFAAAAAVHESGARFFRGGAFKPRTSPYAFAGLGEEGLKLLTELRAEFGLKIVSEALDEPGVDLLEKYADMIQIGARNMQNYTLLRRAGRSHLPVLLKRGMAATLEEWLLAAEYIMAEGNYRIVLCERGVRTFAQHTRNTLDLAVVPAIRRISHLPIVIDASHGTGHSYMVGPLARAGVAVGADGLMIEVHAKPEEALSDGAQSLTIAEYAQLVEEVRAIHDVVA